MFIKFSQLEIYIFMIIIILHNKPVYLKLSKYVTGHDGWINSLSFSSDGLRLLSTSEDDTVRLWDCISGVATNVFQV